MNLIKIEKGITPVVIASLLQAGCGTQNNDRKKATDKEASSPNIVFILIDDLGFSQLGCYGSDYYQTPCIDSLASQGIRFTDAYSAAAVSSPTRASIMTGKYPARLHLTDFIPGEQFPEKPLSQPDWQKYLPIEEVTIAEKLKEAGYVTAMYGKWHLSRHKRPPESHPFNPDKQGFDDHFITYKPKKGLELPWQTPANDGHNVDTITNRALSFLQNHKDTSFLLFISHNTIHDPLMEREGTINKYKQQSTANKPENHPIVAAMIERLDNSVGKVLGEIDKLGLRKNTIVIFYSDNGGRELYAKQKPFRAGKGWLYEGGIRVPLIVRWPGHIEKGIVSDEMISSIDFYPTILDALSVDAQEENIDGVSFLNVLTKQEPLKRNTLFWNYPHYHRGSGMVPGAAVRLGNYKLIIWYRHLLEESDSTFELYNLEKDPGEKNNLYPEMDDKAREMYVLFEQWMEQVDGQKPVLK